MDPNSPYPQPSTPQPPATGTGAQPNAYPPQPQTAQQLGGAATQYPVDYLNQISTNQPVKKLSPVVLFAAIGGVILLAIVTMFMLFQSASPASSSAQLYGLQERINTLDKITAEQGKHLTQTGLASINSTTGAMLKSMNQDVASYAKDRGLNSASKEATKAKNTEKSYYEELSTKLNNAYLTGTLDRVYSSEIAYQLSMLKSKMLSVKTAVKSKKFDEIYQTNIESLNTVSEKLASFQNTK